MRAADSRRLLMQMLAEIEVPHVEMSSLKQYSVGIKTPLFAMGRKGRQKAYVLVSYRNTPWPMFQGVLLLCPVQRRAMPPRRNERINQSQPTFKGSHRS